MYDFIIFIFIKIYYKLGALIYFLNSFYFFAIILGVFTILGGLGGISISYEYVYKKFFKTKYWLKRINKLRPGIDIGFFIENLGAPVIVNVVENVKNCIFINKLFYVAIQTDLNGKVIIYSVTTRDKNFNPIIPYSDIKLGINSFKEMDKFQNGGNVSYWRGAWRQKYIETYELGPKIYQTFSISLNEAGYFDIQKKIPQIDVSVLETDTTDEKVKLFRESVCINTYAVTIRYFSNSKEERDLTPFSLDYSVDSEEVKGLEI